MDPDLDDVDSIEDDAENNFEPCPFCLARLGDSEDCEHCILAERHLSLESEMPETAVNSQCIINRYS